MRHQFSAWLRKAAAVAGSRLRDRQGNTLDRAFVFSWRGRLHLFGLSTDCHLRPVGVVQKRLTYWVQSLCWEQAVAPDFDRLRPAPPAGGPFKVCHVLISHINPARTARMVAEWKRLDPDAMVLVAHGGSEADFAALPPDVTAVYIGDPALRTRDHAREKQEYLAVIKAAADYLKAWPEITHVHLAEYDVIPLVSGLGGRLVASLEAAGADLTGSGMYDLTGTIHPHYLAQLEDTETAAYLQSISCREDRSRILTMLGCTSTWTMACFQSVAALTPPGRIYLEIASATLAHHLGWRVRPLPAQQNHSLTFRGDPGAEAEAWAAKGAWMVHPGKNRW